MPEQLPKEIFNMISDRSTQIKSLNSYAKAIQAVSGKIPAHILEDFIESLRSFNSGIACLELELGDNGYSFDDLAYLTAIVDAAERDKSRESTGNNKTRWVVSIGICSNLYLPAVPLQLTKLTSTSLS